MALSVFDLFSIGIGPSSSHTVGPMRAAGTFGQALVKHNRMDETYRVVVDLYGSLAATGTGHGTDTAVILGLLGNKPEDVDPHAAAEDVRRVREEHKLTLYGGREIAFDPATDLVLHPLRGLAGPPQRLTFTAYDDDGAPLRVPHLLLGRRRLRRGRALDRRGAARRRRHGRAASLPHRATTCWPAAERDRPVHRATGHGERADLAQRGRASARACCTSGDVMQECVTRGCRTEGDPARRL